MDELEEAISRKKTGDSGLRLPIGKMKTVSSFSPASLRGRRPFFYGPDISVCAHTILPQS